MRGENLMRQLLGWITAGLVVASGPTALAQSHEATKSFGINAVVRTKCRVVVERASASLASSQMDVGEMVEGCNNMQGYRIVVSHAPNLQNAALVVEGERVPLSASGETVVSDSNQAAWRRRAVALDPGASQSAMLSTLSFRMEPKGPIF
jgi:hypothetical protein